MGLVLSLQAPPWLVYYQQFLDAVLQKEGSWKRSQFVVHENVNENRAKNLKLVPHKVVHYILLNNRPASQL